jgi:hypothetical protein
MTLFFPNRPLISLRAWSSALALADEEGDDEVSASSWASSESSEALAANPRDLIFLITDACLHARRDRERRVEGGMVF